MPREWEWLRSQSEVVTDWVYKMVSAGEWSAAVRVGSYEGSAVDRRDGFIHLSTSDQISETATKHFLGQEDLIIVAFATQSLGEQLRWEPSRGGQLFPHYYGHVPTQLARWVEAAPLDGQGIPDIPARVWSC
ncbi:MAG: DUF952 domain-containing protein [Hyphomicrobiaceae bacterium]